MSEYGIALVIGAAQGIGRAIAIQLAQDGFDVAFNDIPLNSDTLNARKKGMVEGVVKGWGELNVMVENAEIAKYAHITESTPPTLPLFYLPRR
ncbi:hypothetical protein Moror_5842 [Moniliophthora roreri MCA 2997]|uniref:Uncharacterized protein n=1 Tax=Moniliophthora roreri (strain MCA 2997) TaxID=1381753 RepID=V2X084_MONRO|nr:hypothetical protein Moror_5842 [Moniliophthora roreri MCA 2997]